MADFTHINEQIDNYITTNAQGDITGAILNAILEAMLDAVGEILDNKVNTEQGKGLSANDFTTSLKNKLNSMPNISNYDASNDLITIGDKVYQLSEYVPTPEYYVGWANASTSDFAMMTPAQLIENAVGYTVSSRPQYNGTWNAYILYVMKRSNVTITSATFTSAAGGGAQQLNLATMHDNITINGNDFAVLGKRLGVFNVGQDAVQINFSK